jgi:hypothetical protein
MQVVPQPKKYSSVIGTGIDQKFDYGGSDGSEAKILKDITKTIERFEIGHGYQSSGVRSFGGDSYIHSDIDFDEPSQHKNINHSSEDTRTTQTRDIDKSEDRREKYKNTTDKNDDENDDDNEYDDEDVIEHFNGSLIIEEEERVLISKCILVAILFIIVNHTFWDKYIIMLSETLKDYMIVVKAIFFCMLFYLTEKFLLK